MSGIALRYGITQGQLRRANGIGADNKIRTGQKLQIPTVSSAPRSKPAQAGRAHPQLSASRASTRNIIAATARRYGVDPDLALAVGWQESRWRHDSFSHKGAVGAMQCLPQTARWMSEKVGRTLDVQDVRDNATCGVLLLKTLQAQTDREATVLAAYYQGMSSVRSNGPFSSTRRYVASVQGHRDQIAAGKRPRG
ncbi:transglycosylase SLT domain-containing protein [Gephyromycinifex aptenodytis]|uniref:transglycosylase SLT domain-containing protein n=1 Tax=Gephyromycinifex aptenodytis TaxID=2716227 RepID=UPI001447F6F9